MFSNFFEIVRKVYFLARPYGLRKPLLLIAVVFVQGLFQVIGVASIFPFLSIAANPTGFRASAIGMRILAFAPDISDSRLLLFAGIFSIFSLCASNAVNLFSDYSRGRYGEGLGHWLRIQLMTEIVSQPWSYFLRINTGILLKKANTDVMQMINQVLLALMEGFSRLVTVVFLVITLIIVNPFVAIGSALLLAVYYTVIFRFLISRRVNASKTLKDAYRGTMIEAQQFLGGIKPIKVQRAEQYFLSRYGEHSAALARINSVLPLYYSAPKYLLEPLAFGGIIVVVISLASLGQGLDQILPVMGVIGFAALRLLPAAQILYAQLSQISTSRHNVEEIYEEFKKTSCDNTRIVRRKQITAPTDIPMTWNREVRLENVTFEYHGGHKPVINNINLTVEKNISIGIIGPTGSGKSTLVDLILGLHSPTSGRIFIDEIPLADENIRAWQAGIGYVPQDVFLLDDTIARNIAFGVTDDEINWIRLREVAAAAQILEFIEKGLSDGFNTLVGERGIRMSGGQRQRIAMARALYHRPHILLLDEATSSLDTATEKEVTNAIRSLHGTITMIIVAHRTVTIEHCDKIVQLKSERHAT